MPRPRNYSKVQIPPRVKGFIPMGYYAHETEPIQLNIEEYECIRLLDYEGLSQVEAAKFMEVSRPTLTRIYLRARKKIALALTEAKQIIIEGGKAVFEGTWFLCNKCQSRFNSLEGGILINCALCGSVEIELIQNEDL